MDYTCVCGTVIKEKTPGANADLLEIDAHLKQCDTFKKHDAEMDAKYGKPNL